MSSGPRCPSCKARSSEVLDARPAPNWFRRRRECIKCGDRFTTYETVEKPGAALDDLPIRVRLAIRILLHGVD